MVCSASFTLGLLTGSAVMGLCWVLASGLP